MSVSIQQVLILGAKVKNCDLEKVGIDEYFWEDYCEQHGYRKHVPFIKGLHFISSLMNDFYFVGCLLKEGDSTDGFVQTVNLDELGLTKEKYDEVNALFESLGLTDTKASLYLATAYS